MWKIMLLAAAVSLIIVGTLALAEQPFMVKCCVKGNCRTMTRPECNRVGYIVASCGQCK